MMIIAPPPVVSFFALLFPSFAHALIRHKKMGDTTKRKSGRSDDPFDGEGGKCAKKSKKEKKEKKTREKRSDDESEDRSNHKSFPAASSGKTETPPPTTKKRAFRLRLKGIAPNTDKAQVAQFLSVSESCVRNVFHGEAIVMVDTEEAFQRCVEKDDEKLNGRFVKVTDETNGARSNLGRNFLTPGNNGENNAEVKRKTTTNEREGRDWTCEKCGGENFARRETCYKCAAGKYGEQRETPPVMKTSASINTAVIKKQNNAGDRMVAQGSEQEGYEVFVKYLPKNVDESDIADFFKRCGELKEEVNLLRDQTTGSSKGAGFLTFRNAESREKALAMDGERFLDRTVSVTVAKKSPFGTRGTTQALGTHTPAMLRETIDSLGIANDPNGIYIDGTFGRGGHARGILNALGKNGQLHAFDLDPEAITVGRALEKEDSRFHMHHSPFGSMFKVMREKDSKVKVSGVFLDLGISSPQFDDKSRGFRPEQDGPLDLRFDVTSGVSAYDFLLKVSRNDLRDIIFKYGETNDKLSAQRIADAIVLARDTNALPKTTKAFATLVANAKGAEYQAMHPAKMTFQALRIHLNEEFDEFRRGMEGAMKLLKENGKLGVLTWKHSECAILIEYFRKVEKVRTNAPIFEWLKTNHEKSVTKLLEKDDDDDDAWAAEMDDCKRPADIEMRTNSRSRSAILHVLRKKSSAARMVEAEKAAYKKLKWENKK